jgi:hypothetical protein
MLTNKYLSSVDVQTIKQFAKFLARFEEGNSLRWHFDSDSSFWVASDASWSLPCMETSESPDFNLVPGWQSADDAVKYGADEGVGFLHRHRHGFANLIGQIGPSHLAPRRRTTKEYHRASLTA